MSNKITWKKIFEDFKIHHPTLAKKVTYWRPKEYSKIEVTLKDGMMLIYDYDEHKSTIVRTSWR